MATRWSAWSATVVTKLLIAVTGLALFLYLVLHLVGNLLIFLGPTLFNGYSEKLVTNPLIIPIEIGLALILIIHVYKTVPMWLANQQARPVPYVKKTWAGGTSRKSLGSTTMIWTGLITLLFVVIHVRMFKFGTFYHVGATDERDLYRLEIETFANPFWVGFYVVGLILIGFHLWHGFSSSFESLGGNHPRYTPRVVVLGKVVALLIAGGFIFIPLWFYFVGGRS